MGRVKFAILMVGLAATALAFAPPIDAKPSSGPERGKRPPGRPSQDGAALHLRIDGRSIDCQPKAALTTRSGTWRLCSAGEPVPGIAAYGWTLDQNPAFIRVMLARRATEPADGELAPVSLQVTAARGNRSFDAMLLTVPGSIRIAQNMQPVAPNPDWLREAVATNRIPAFNRATPLGTLAPLRTSGNAEAYDPNSLMGGSSSKNFIGVTSSQGGEHSASRGYVHDVDARFVDAALRREDGAIAAAFPWLTTFTLTALGHPQGGVWSSFHATTVDPQFPQPRERGWSLALDRDQKRPQVMILANAKKWRRDVAHLENVGYAHWLLTEDPVAGLVLNRQLAYALAGYYAYMRPTRGKGGYGYFKEEPRGIYNSLSALQKSSVVAQRVGAADDVLWGTQRLARMTADIWQRLDADLIAPLDRATPSQADLYARRVSGLGTMDEVDTGKPYKRLRPDGSLTYYRTASDFQQPQYGKEPLYLWTMAGNGVAARALRHDTLGAINRILYLGGAMGGGEMPSSTGSGIFYGPFDATGTTTSVRSGREWAEWAARTWGGKVSRTSFDGTYTHTVLQLRQTLLYARAAIQAGRMAPGEGVTLPQIDAALAAWDRAAAETTRWQRMLMVKHTGSPATDRRI